MWSSLFLFLKRDDLQNENLEADRVDALLQYDWCM
jgi:hypothetical protein